MQKFLMPIYSVVKPNGVPMWGVDIEPGKMTVAVFTEELFAERAINDICPDGKIVQYDDDLQFLQFLNRCIKEGVSYVSIDYQKRSKAPFQCVAISEIRYFNSGGLE